MEMLRKRFRGLYDFRFLIRQLVSKDIKLKYRRSFLGYLWSVLNPLLVMLVLVIVFSSMFRFDIENYPAYLIIGQTLFSYMTESTNQSLTSITGNASLLKKVYVPKYIFTLSKVTSSLVNVLFSLGAMLIVFIVTKVHFSFYMLLIPIVLIELYMFCLGLSLFLAQLSVFFRDIQYIYAVITTAWMYLTPLFYPMESLPEKVQQGVRICNPMYHYIDQFRTLVLEACMPPASTWGYGFGVAFVILVIGTWTFRRSQDRFILYI
ncbi:MAG: ABC transporter permease [Lachnospiraceae bacterium]|nr:ABC transporter permease [Lachnospiraceae bacterium]